MVMGTTQEKSRAESGSEVHERTPEMNKHSHRKKALICATEGRGREGVAEMGSACAGSVSRRNGISQMDGSGYGRVLWRQYRHGDGNGVARGHEPNEQPSGQAGRRAGWCCGAADLALFG